MFDRKKLTLRPLKERKHELDISSVLPLGSAEGAVLSDDWKRVGKAIVAAKKKGSAVILMAGAHVFRSGTQNFMIDLMQRGYISCLATNGAGMIHDFELALIGATTEGVARYIKDGQFGLWKETGRINDIINEAYKRDEGSGMGEAVGRAIQAGDYPHKDISIFAAADRLKMPVTVHVGIGYDIIHEHPNCDGAATGALSYNDFLKFASVVSGLEGGVVMNFGSAVMAPEIFLKALSMARNVSGGITDFTTLVSDIKEVPQNFRQEPSKEESGYYFRPWKTMLVRTVAGNNKSFYIKGKHADNIPALWKAISEAENI